MTENPLPLHSIFKTQQFEPPALLQAILRILGTDSTAPMTLSILSCS